MLFSFYSNERMFLVQQTGIVKLYMSNLSGILLLGTFRISPFFWVALILYKNISHFCCVVCFILRRKSAWILNYMYCKYMYFWRWHRIIDNVKSEGVSFTGEYSGINESPLNGNLKGGCCSSKLSKWSDCSLMFFSDLTLISCGNFALLIVFVNLMKRDA